MNYLHISDIHIKYEASGNNTREEIEILNNGFVQ